VHFHKTQTRTLAAAKLDPEGAGLARSEGGQTPAVIDTVDGPRPQPCAHPKGMVVHLKMLQWLPS